MMRARGTCGSCVNQQYECDRITIVQDNFYTKNNICACGTTVKKFPQSVVLYPCGHLACSSCAQKPICGVCKERVERVTHMLPPTMSTGKQALLRGRLSKRANIANQQIEATRQNLEPIFNILNENGEHIIEPVDEENADAPSTTGRQTDRL